MYACYHEFYAYLKIQNCTFCQIDTTTQQTGLCDLFASLKKSRPGIFVPDNRHTDIIWYYYRGDVPERGVFVFFRSHRKGPEISLKNPGFAEPPGAPRDATWQSGPMGPILLSAVLAASKAMRQQVGGKWGNGVALEKGGWCVWNVRLNQKRRERFSQRHWSRWFFVGHSDIDFSFKVLWLHH